MLIDARQLPPDARIEADVCIVGGGAAGVTLARELIGHGLEVALFESGGFEYDAETQRLYLGEESGTLIGEASAYLASSRLRYFGGTTNHWQGWCRPLDPEVFVPREWVSEDGWPLRRPELEPFYERAAELVEISPFNYPNHWLDQPNRRFLFSPKADLETVFFHFSPPVRFGTHFRDALEGARDLRLYLHANLVRIATGPNADRVTGLELRTLAGGRLTARGRVHVLALGAVENARLLLASNQVQPEGLGNGRDLVGRYFMDHPILRVGHALVSSPQRSVDRYTPFVIGNRGHRARGVLRLRWAAQERLRLPGALVVLDPMNRETPPEWAAAMSGLALDMTRLEIGDDAVRRRRVETMGIRVVTEPIPSAASRVRLAAETDALGVPRSRLEWTLSDADADNLRRVSEHFARELSWRHRGRVHLRIDDGDVWPLGSWSNHSMGTTRMHDDPARGVVDRNCRVHGIDNLFVAGASVFPTVGPSNPTFTLLALAIRLAERLKEMR